MLDLAHNRLELPKASASSGEAGNATLFAQSLPSSLRILDYRGNAALETGETFENVYGSYVNLTAIHPSHLFVPLLIRYAYDTPPLNPCPPLSLSFILPPPSPPTHM